MSTGAASPIREIIAYRELLWMLVWRDVRVRYKHSLLGAAWAILPPLATMAVFVLVFRGALRVGADVLTGSSRTPYPLFALAGLVPWMYFVAALNGSVGSLVANRPLLTKVQFPREVFPFAAVGAALLDFAVSGLAVAGLAAWYALSGEWSFQFHWSLALLPLVVLVQTTLLCGLALLLAMGHVFYRDVGFILRAVLPLMMFVTNVVYDWHGAGPRLRMLAHLNPMTPIIAAYRDCLLHGRAPDPATFGYAAAVSGLTLAAAWSWYHRREYEFAECA
jgi:lipopolysaccharide transport system permease protein